MPIARRLLLGAIGTLPLTRLAHGAVEQRLTLLNINDFHSRHTPVDPRAMSCVEGPACFGSSPRLATAIGEQRRAAEADGRTVLLLDAGDQFQGSLFYTAHHGAAELAVQHAIGVDAMAVGNHEFDNGPETLGRYIDAARFPVLSANIDATQDPNLAGRIKPFTMLERAGLKIAIIGLTTEETRTSSSPGPNVRITAPGPALIAAMAEARAQGATLLILLSHLGLPLDRTIDTPGLAVIIGGHTHTLLSNDEKEAQSPHPTPGRNSTLIVQAGAYGRYLGRLDLDIGSGGAVIAYGGACRHIGADLTEDPAVSAIVARFAAPIEALRRKPVGTLPEPLDIKACRIAQCPLGAMVAAALRAAAHAGPGTPIIGLMNAGGLRAGLPAGPVTLGQVLEALPFGNTLATATLTGEDLRATVEHGLAMTARGGFPQWSGLRLSAQIDVQNTDQTWSPLDPSRQYLLATSNFLRTGGDGYADLRDHAQNPYDTGPPIADLVAESLARLPPRLPPSLPP